MTFVRKKLWKYGPLPKNRNFSDPSNSCHINVCSWSHFFCFEQVQNFCYEPFALSFNFNTYFHVNTVLLLWLKNCYWNNPYNCLVWLTNMTLKNLQLIRVGPSPKFIRLRVQITTNQMLTCMNKGAISQLICSNTFFKKQQNTNSF